MSDEHIYTDEEAAAIANAARAPYIDFDECEKHPVKRVRMVPVPQDDTDW